MIIGIGSDLTDITRIADVINDHGDRFLQRCFTSVERQRADRPENDADVRVASYAKRWSAKEACAKALGIGIAGGVYLRDIGVVNDEDGRPTIELTGGARDRLKEITPAGMRAHIHVSLTDEPPYAQAFVVISAVPE